MKIKFGDKSFDLADGGIGKADDRATICIIQQGTDFATIEAAVKENLNDIKVVDESGNIISTINGYDTVESIQKFYDLDVSGKLYENVIVVTLLKTDEKEMNTKISALQTATATNATDITDIQLALTEIFEQLVAIAG